MVEYHYNSGERARRRKRREAQRRRKVIILSVVTVLVLIAGIVLGLSMCGRGEDEPDETPSGNMDSQGDEVGNQQDPENQVIPGGEDVSDNPDDPDEGQGEQMTAKIPWNLALVNPWNKMEEGYVPELKTLDNGRKAGSLSAEKQSQSLSVIDMLEQYMDMIAAESDGMQAFALLKMDFDTRVKQLKQRGQEKGLLLENLFGFAEEVFAGGHELLIIVTELTTNPYTAKYISEYGCEKYFAHNQELLFYERQKKLMQEIQELNLTVGDDAL